MSAFVCNFALRLVGGVAEMGMTDSLSIFLSEILWLDSVKLCNEWFIFLAKEKKYIL